MARLYAATGDGVACLDESGGQWTVELSLRGSGAQCLAVDPADANMLYAGLRDDGVRRGTDGGRTWVDCALPEAGVFSLAVSAADGAIYAGTEPSRLFRSDDGGRTWRELEALLELPSQPTWSFPPRPWTSHVRWIAPSPHDADLLLVGIELGGLMRSSDGGRSWHDHRLGEHRPLRRPRARRPAGTDLPATRRRTLAAANGRAAGAAAGDALRAPCHRRSPLRRPRPRARARPSQQRLIGGLADQEWPSRARFARSLGPEFRTR